MTGPDQTDPPESAGPDLAQDQTASPDIAPPPADPAPQAEPSSEPPVEQPSEQPLLLDELAPDEAVPDEPSPEDPAVDETAVEEPALIEAITISASDDPDRPSPQDRPVPDGGVFGAIGLPPVVLNRPAPSESFSNPAAAPSAPQPSSTASGFRQAGRRLRLRIAGLTGWMRYLLAALAGLLAGFTMAPYYFLPLLPLAFVVLVWMIDGLERGGKGRRQAFALGWWFGFPFFLTGFYWIAFAFLVEADSYAWMIPFAMSALPAGLALFTGAAFWLAKALWAPGPLRILTFAVAFSLFELLRGTIFTGLPWNLMGYAWGSVPDVLQVTAYIGIYGLSFLTVLTAASPAALFAHQKETTNWRWPFLALVVIGVIWTAGAVRLYMAPIGPESYVEGVNLRIVQPNIPQADKWRPENQRVIWERLLAQTEVPSSAPITHVIWPESAPPFILAQEASARRDLAGVLNGAVLITGALRAERQSDGTPVYFNALHVLGPDASILATYDKHHLVPFGEYLPFRSFLERFGFQNLAAQRVDFRAGPGPRTLNVPGAPDMGPLVCFEAVFPGQVVDPARRPGWLVQVTDDSWFGGLTGPRQHFGIARVRAIEEGLPLVRAANTGISAVIDPYGRTLETLGLGAFGIIDSPLPNATAVTLYARFGDWPLVGFLMLAAIALARRRRNADV